MSCIENVVVVGGGGAVGAMFADLLTKAGLPTTVVDLPGAVDGVPECACEVIEGDVLRPGEQLRTVLAGADLVLLALPEHVACAAVPKVASMLKPGALLADTLSVKAGVAAAWALVEADVEAVSLNPMFAPSLGATGRPVAAVVLRDGPKAAALMRLIEDGGYPVVRMEPDEHDTITAAVQAMTHAALLGFGLALRHNDVALEPLLRVAPPPFQALLALVARVAGGTPEVYWDIQQANLHAPQSREMLSTGLRRLNNAVALGESDFSGLFADINEFLGPAGHLLREHAQTMLTVLPGAWPAPSDRKSSWGNTFGRKE